MRNIVAIISIIITALHALALATRVHHRHQRIAVIIIRITVAVAASDYARYSVSMVLASHQPYEYMSVLIVIISVSGPKARNREAQRKGQRPKRRPETGGLRF